MGTALPEVVTYIIGQFTSMAAKLLTEPLFLISIGFFVVGGVIGLVKRIL